MWRIVIKQATGRRLSKFVEDLSVVAIPKTAQEVVIKRIKHAEDMEEETNNTREEFSRRLIDFAERLRRELDGKSLSYYIPMASVLLYISMTKRHKINGRALNSLYTKHKTVKKLVEKGLLIKTTKGYRFSSRLYELLEGER